ncbi:nitrate ABC transporter substrate-binding protein [Xaviernesmea oryzae]|uniref:Nitrate ABC transporter substrate-binding protein n=2 Tax=Xaviernesmea oryzae TaxID=464029 RepID=A0A1Q9AV31_9HYPH|nr:nitrate ABC transporter substrate-binding protein [Xaviernesmea oryzae]
MQGRGLRLAAAALAAWLGLSAAPAFADEAISAARCAQNKAAGKITFLTSFAYAASAGILDVVAANELGYFKALCLDVAMEPGSTNTQLVSAGTAQLAGLGGASDVLVAVDNGADLVGVATYGNVGAIELLTMADSGIETLKDFAGKTVGYKGAIPPQFLAMFLDAGLDQDSVNWVSVGYDPVILPNGSVQGLAAYKSNEPKALAAKGYKVKEWDPDAFGVHSTFNTLVANGSFAKAHPTVVEDFLRATFKAFAWINASDDHLDQALAAAAALSTSGYDLETSKARWKVEMDLIAKSLPKGAAVGQQSLAQWTPEAETLSRFKLIKTAEIAKAQDNRYIDAVVKDGAVVWPAP